ncbi:MAG: helicase-related protein, partial [Microthrixaceae bacterium]
MFVAPPGTGKTTGMPPALAGRPHGPDRRMVVVVPRRMAARAAARMAAMSGETVGQTFGYSVRDDRRVGRRTVVEMVTPGLLLRRVQSDPALEGISTVLLDEFHERSLDQDLLLALLVELRGAIRQDLGLVVMSATLDVAPVRSLLGALTDDGGEVPLIEVSSPVHPIDTHWRPGSAHDRISDRVRDVVLEAMGDQEGDVLAFLPGRGEISATARGLRDRLGRTGSGRGARGAAAEVIELHGTSPAAVQEMVLEPRAAGPRRIVLATAVAETSITVPGVRVVVDSGLSRFQSFDPGTGLPALRTGSVSLSTAEQRRGRAGREAPGHCYRLWARRDEELMRAHDPPEITRADLAGLLLATSVWGASSPSELKWLDPPPKAAVDAARVLLAELGALDDDGRPT